jgi:hypothetical protein
MKNNVSLSQIKKKDRGEEKKKSKTKNNKVGAMPPH